MAVCDGNANIVTMNIFLPVRETEAQRFAKAQLVSMGLHTRLHERSKTRFKSLFAVTVLREKSALWPESGLGCQKWCLVVGRRY